MLTSAEELQTSINKLKNIQSAFQQKDILKGTYSLNADSVIIFVQRSQSQSQPQVKRRGKPIEDESTTFRFLIELQIDDNLMKKKFNKISWSNYKVIQRKGVNESTSEFDMPSPKFPPFYYSRVKSLHAESHDVLKV